MWRMSGWLAWGVGAALPGMVIAQTPAEAPAVEAVLPPAAIKTDRVVLVCEAVYLPTRAVWNRTVTIEYGKKRVLSVAVDGVPVYSFSVRGTVIATSMDNERIQIDTATQSWTSDFRGLASSQGHCERGA